MNPWTYLFPVLALLYLAAFFLMGMHRKTPVGKKPPRQPTPPEKNHDRGNVLPMLLLTAVYALAAFWNLGDASAPETYAPMPTNSRVEIRLAEPVQLGRIFCFAGLNTGESDVYILQNDRLYDMSGKRVN